MTVARRLGLTSILALLLGSSLWAEAFVPRFEAGTSFSLGGATELVLRDGTYNSPISRLQWSVPPVVSLDLSVALPWNSWTATQIGTRVGHSVLTGRLVDEDWNVDTFVYGRSEHELYLTSTFSITASQTFLWDGWTFAAGAIYSQKTWEGWNGTYRYEQTFGTSTGSFSGLVLGYRQEWYIPFVGVANEFRFGDLLWVPNLRLGPYSWCLDRDDHLLASKRYTYLDIVRGGIYGAASLELTLPPSTWNAGLRLGVEGSWGAVGDTYVTYPAVVSGIAYPLATNSAGAWFWEASLTAFVRN